MPLRPGHSLIRADPSSLVPVRNNLANRFYEPIVFLVCLNQVLKHNQTSKAPELSSDMVQSPEHAFHNFVNKLGQLCDRETTGNTVTAFVVLKLPDGIQYRFASNQQEEEELGRAKAFIIDVLETLGRADGNELKEVTSLILRNSLSFTRPMIEAYIKSLKENSALCIAACTREGTEDSKYIFKELEKLQALLFFSDNENLDNKSFSKHCESLLNAINRLYHSRTNGLIRNKTNEGRMNESEFWCEFRHATGRLRSYLEAAKVLVSARKQWPELFENFEVCFIASSSPARSPLRKVETISMEKIIGRMTSDPEKMKSYKARAQELEKFGLDKRIRKLAGQKTFRPIVHAEVLLLDSLERDGGTNASRFFNGYRYIGCSKPTCRLCHYYFSFRASDIHIRPTHRNIYRNWRMPDVHQSQGPNAGKEREKLMNEILVVIRADTFRTLAERVPERKHHDSNTEPTYLIDSTSSRALEDLEQLAIDFKQLDMESSGDEAILNSSPRISFSDGNSSIPESEDEGEDGGAKL